MYASSNFAPPNDLKFSIGTRVQMVSYEEAPDDQKKFIHLFHASGEKKKSYLETIMTISDCIYSRAYGVWCYRMEEDGGKFVWPDGTVAFEVSNPITKERGIDRPMPFI